MQKGKTGGDSAFNQSATSWVLKSSASLDNLFFFFCRGVKNGLHCVVEAPIKLDKFSELLLSQRDPNAKKKSNLESTTVHLCTDVCVMVQYF